MLDDGEEVQGSLAQTTSDKQVRKRCADEPVGPLVAKRPETSFSPPSDVGMTPFMASRTFMRVDLHINDTSHLFHVVLKRPKTTTMKKIPTTTMERSSQFSRWLQRIFARKTSCVWLHDPLGWAMLDYSLYCMKQRKERTLLQRVERTRPTAVVAPQVPLNIPTKPAIRNEEWLAAIKAGLKKYQDSVSRTSFPLSSPEYLGGAGRNELVVLGDLATAQGVIMIISTFSLKLQLNSHSQGHQVPAGNLAFPGSVTPDVCSMQWTR
jgi:hypothetical protein